MSAIWQWHWFNTQSVYSGTGSAINICRGDTDSVNGSLLYSICSHFPLGTAIIRSDEKINDMSLVKAVLAVCWVCLPVLQSRPDYGFIELGYLPLQHGPQALSQAVVVFLQLLLVLFLVWCDEVFVLLNCLTTSTGQRAETGWNDIAWDELNIFDYFNAITSNSRAASTMSLCKPILQ